MLHDLQVIPTDYFRMINIICINSFAMNTLGCIKIVTICAIFALSGRYYIKRFSDNIFVVRFFFFFFFFFWLMLSIDENFLHAIYSEKK